MAEPPAASVLTVSVEHLSEGFGWLCDNDPDLKALREARAAPV